MRRAVGHFGVEVTASLRRTHELRDRDAFASGSIAHFKIARYFKFVDEFQMTVTGKVQKFKMREQAVKELGLGETTT